jgi:hypothetical protein
MTRAITSNLSSRPSLLRGRRVKKDNRWARRCGVVSREGREDGFAWDGAVIQTDPASPRA